LRGFGHGTSLILNSHMDTVPPGDDKDWTFGPFSAEIKNDNLYGRGACDNKGSLTAMIMAANALQKADAKLKGDLLLTAVVDEETGGEKGTKYLVDKGLIKGDMGIACGTSNFKIYVASRGGVRLEIITKGRLSHAAMPHLGINAVEKMAKVILAVKELNLNHKPHRLLGSPTIASGTMIQGGVKINMIPNICKASFDIRTVPNQTPDEVLNEIRDCLSCLKKTDRNFNADIKTLRVTEPAEISENEKIVQVTRDITTQITGKKPKIAGLPGATDARFLINKAQIPTIVDFGPGRLDQCHVADEHIEIDQVVTATKIYALIALQICGYQQH
jgi:succinyl-diaminopimelate desuccinylase